MIFQLTKISDQGESNPIVARLTVQTSELIKFSPRGDEFHKSVITLFHDHIQKHLLECDQISRDIISEILDIDSQINQEGFRTQSGGRVIEVPHIIRLESRVEQFLYCAKSALRDLAKIFTLFFGKTFDKARYDKIAEWAEKDFGKDSDLARIIRQGHDIWIKKLVAMRNAVEHPGGYSGRLNIHNISLVPPDDPRYPILTPPSLNLNEESPKPIVEYFQSTVNVTARPYGRRGPCLPLSIRFADQVA